MLQFKSLVYLAAGATIAAASAGLVWFAPHFGAAARISAAQADAANWRKNSGEWERYGKATAQAFRASEQLRATAEATAASAVAGADALCTARVDAARQSATAIGRIITKEPARDTTTNCPLRSFTDPGWLQDALRPAPPAGG